jgi:hypothetical protein
MGGLTDFLFMISLQTGHIENMILTKAVKRLGFWGSPQVPADLDEKTVGFNNNTSKCPS